MDCNLTCCTTSDGITVCFNDKNYTDLWVDPADWEIGVRYTICIPLVLMGVIGNSLTIFLLIKNKLLMQTSVNLFILNMAIADLIHSLCGPIPYTIDELNQFWVLGQVWCYAENYIQVQVKLVSMASIAVISFDRMLGIVRPFHRYLKKWSSLLVIGLIWIYASALASPFAIYKNYYRRQWADVLQTSCEQDKKHLHTWYDIVNIGSFWIPLTIMVLCYGTIFYNFNKYNRTKQEHPASLHMKRRVLRMLVSLTLLVIFLWVPVQAFEIAKWYLLDADGHFKDQYTKKVYNIMLTISKYLMFVVPAVNPIVYALMHQNFKRAYKTTFTCCFKEKPRYFLSMGEGSRPFMWSLRTGMSALASSMRRRSVSMRGRIDTQFQSHSVQGNSYGNTLTVPGQEPNLDIKDTNRTSYIVSEPTFSQQSNSYDNNQTLNITTYNGNEHSRINDEIHLEASLSQNINCATSNSVATQETNSNIKTAVDKHIKLTTVYDTGYVNTLNVLSDEPNINDSSDSAGL